MLINVTVQREHCGQQDSIEKTPRGRRRLIQENVAGSRGGLATPRTSRRVRVCLLTLAAERRLSARFSDVLSPRRAGAPRVCQTKGETAGPRTTSEGRCFLTERG